MCVSLSLCVCVCVCVYVYTCVRYVCMTSARRCIYFCILACIHTYNIHTCACMHVYTHTTTHTHTHTHSLTHSLTHTHTQHTQGPFILDPTRLLRALLLELNLKPRDLVRLAFDDVRVSSRSAGDGWGTGGGGERECWWSWCLWLRCCRC